MESIEVLPKELVINEENLLSRIHLIRGEKVILDYDLANLYEIETKNLKRAVKRNMKRFPPDFMFELTQEELENLRCQFGTSSYGGNRYLSYAFTEHGVAMLSSVLNSDKAIEVNIAIMRAFVQIRKYTIMNKELFNRMDKIEINFESLKDLVLKLIIQEQKPKNRMGFIADISKNQDFSA